MLRSWDTCTMERRAYWIHSYTKRTRWNKDMDNHMRYTDAHLLERDRGISIKSAPLSLVLEGTKRKSYLLNLIDTPGHTNFQDEVAAACRLADGVVLVVRRC